MTFAGGAPAGKDESMKPWMGVALDALVIVCLTVLLALKAIPAEVGLSMLGLLVGAKATHRLGGGGGDAGGASGSGGTSSSSAASAAAASSTLALVVALGTMFMRHKGAATALVLGAIGLSTMTGCAPRPIDTAIEVANTSHDVGEAAADAIKLMCTDRYATAKAADVPQIDKVCIPASATYSLYRTSHASLVAEIQAAQAGRVDVAELLQRTTALGQAAKMLSEKMGALK